VQAIARGDLPSAPVSEAERALLEFVGLVTKRAHETRPHHIEKLRAHAWSDQQIAEAVYITALFAFFNRVADAFGIEPMGYLEANALTP
jgi:alkylhydroperoxidase family enzyme